MFFFYNCIMALGALELSELCILASNYLLCSFSVICALSLLKHGSHEI